MPTLTIPEETYRRLAERAAALGITADALAIPALEQAARESTCAAPENQDWQKRWDELNNLIMARSDRYPAGYQADVSRETIYEGRDE